jgi:hypothetical protein
VLEERCDEIAEEGLSMRRRPAQVAVFHVAARHDGQEELGDRGRGGIAQWMLTICGDVLGR